MGYSNNKDGPFSKIWGIPYISVRKWRQLYHTNHSYFYIIKYENFRNIDFIPNKIIKLAKKYKKFFIVLENSFEGYAYKNFYYIDEFVKKHKLEKKVIYVCGHYNTETEHKIWCSRKNVKKTFYSFSYNIFFYLIQGWITDFSIKKTQWFCCLNHRPHHHRLAAVTYMDYLNMIDDGIVTCHDKNYETRTTNNTEDPFGDSIKQLENLIEPEYYAILKSQFLKTKQKLPLVYDIPDLTNGCQPDNFNLDIYNNCLINLVTETFYMNYWNFSSEMFITEKTTKPMLTNQIFIIIGPRGILKKLKEMGFKTFNEFFDESYDDLPDSVRVFKAVETLRHVMETYDLKELEIQTRKIRKHNLNMLKKIKININFQNQLGI